MMDKGKGKGTEHWNVYGPGSPAPTEHLSYEGAMADAQALATQEGSREGITVVHVVRSGSYRSTRQVWPDVGDIWT